MRDKKLLESYIKEAVLLELKFSSDYSKLWDTLKGKIKSKMKSLFSFDGEGGSTSAGDAKGSPGPSPIKDSDVSSEIDSVLEDIESFYEKKISSSAKRTIKQNTMDVYKKFLKKGSSQQEAMKKAMNFMQLQVSKISV